jgi:phytoene dehydrogenase-like protein
MGDEAQASRACGSDEGTLPGFVHDVGAAFFPFGKASPAFVDLDLVGHGLKWCNAPIESAFPAPDGSNAILSRDLDVMAANFGDPRDGERFAKICRWHQKVESKIFDAMLRPLVPIGAALRLLPFDILRLAWTFTTSGAGLARRWFNSEPARRVIPGLALHTDVGPNDTFGSGIGYMLAVTATTGGYAVPVGGAQAITDTLVRMLETHGGSLRLGARVTKIEVEGKRARGVVLEDGTRIRAKRAVVANTSVPALFGKLVESSALPGRIVRRSQKFAQGWGTFKMDWALDGPVPWAVQECADAAVVHAGDSLADLTAFTQQARAGQLPDNPYLVIGQQSRFDRSRAPEGHDTLWAYSRVPSASPKGWAQDAELYADRIEARIDGLAPGFRDRVKARRIVAPPDLEKMDANLRGGDLGGGSNAWHRQLIFRPIFPYFRHRTPIRGLYMSSSYTHPGAGVHGMCGWDAAQMVLQDLS